MKLFTGVSHFFYFLLIFCNADGGVCHGCGADVEGVYGVLVRAIAARNPFEIRFLCAKLHGVLGARPLRNSLFSCDLVGLLVGRVYPLCGPERPLFDLCGPRCDPVVRLGVERLSHPLCGLSHLLYDP
jgi:hypothetical protein